MVSGVWPGSPDQQVEVDAGKPRADRIGEQRGNLFVRLDPVNGLLDDRIEILNAERQDVDPALPISQKPFLVHPTRVDLHMNLFDMAQIGEPTERGEHPVEVGKIENAGRAAAEIEAHDTRSDTVAGKEVREQNNFRQKAVIEVAPHVGIVGRDRAVA